jgi:GDP-L-fucose synthase
MAPSLTGKRICVTGGAGFLGRAVCARLRACAAGAVFVPRSREFDLTDAGAARRMLETAEPEVVIHLAAEVGGIGANQRQPGRFFYANMAMGLNLIEQCRLRGVEKLVMVGTVCAYPKHCPAPFREADLWSGFPEETNAPYGVAKRALSTMLAAYRAQYGFNGVYLVPVNLYGPGDNFDLETSHVIPALIRKFCEAVGQRLDTVTCWGTGKVSREFLYVDDAAEAIVAAAAVHNDPAPINLGTGREITIADLARKIAGLCGYSGRIEWDPSRPDGQPRRVLDTSRATALLKWCTLTSLDEGLEQTIAWWRTRAADRVISP